MKCELCHKVDAQVPVTVSENGTTKELYVCKACAAKVNGQSNQEKPHHPPHRKGPKLTVMGKDADNLPQPLVDGLVKATIDFMKGVAEVEENEKHVCPLCKSNWDKIKDSGRITCPACWKTFAKQIRAEFLAGEYAPRHMGAAPAVTQLSNPESARSVLERKLKEAIAREDYRQAAAIKRQIDELPSNPEDRS